MFISRSAVSFILVMALLLEETTGMLVPFGIYFSTEDGEEKRFAATKNMTSVAVIHRKTIVEVAMKVTLSKISSIARQFQWVKFLCLVYEGI